MSQSVNDNDPGQIGFLEQVRAIFAGSDLADQWSSLLEGEISAQTEAHLICKSNDGFLVDSGISVREQGNLRDLINTTQSGVLVIQHITIDLVTNVLNSEGNEIDLAFFLQHFCPRSIETTKLAGCSLLCDYPKGWHLDFETGFPPAIVDFKFCREDNIFRSPSSSSNASGLFRASFHRFKPNLFLVLIGGKRTDSLSHLWLDGMQTRYTFDRAMPGTGRFHRLEHSSTLAGIIRYHYRDSWNLEMLCYCSQETVDRDQMLNVFCQYFSFGFVSATLNILDTQIIELSSSAINNPSLNDLRSMTDCRKTLQRITQQLARRRGLTPDGVMMWEDTRRPKILKALSGRTFDEFEGKHLTEKYKDMNKRVESLLASVSDTFQLLISIMSVRDSQENKNQSRNSMILTILASFYLPFSLGTGIYGMNVKEINGKDSTSHWWSLVVAVIVIFIVSILLVVLVVRVSRTSTWRRWKRKLLEGEV